MRKMPLLAAVAGLLAASGLPRVAGKEPDWWGDRKEPDNMGRNKEKAELRIIKAEGKRHRKALRRAEHNAIDLG